MSLILKFLDSLVEETGVNKGQKKPQIQQKRFNVEKLEPWVTNDLFTVNECDRILRAIDEHQYDNGKGYSDRFYDDINTLLYGCYMAGYTDGISDLSPDVYNKLKENFEKL